MEFLKMLTDTARNLLSNKSVQEVIKYVATTTITYASNKYNKRLYKYDTNDNRNMIYHHNMNNDNKIDPVLSEQARCLYKIDRFIRDIGEEKNTLDSFLDTVSKVSGEEKYIDELKESYRNPTLLCFDHDTLETSSIIDTSEINSGKIYVPDRSIKVYTSEGMNILDIKNDYLKNRVKLGKNPSEVEMYTLLKDFHQKMESDKVKKYFEEAYSKSI